MGTYYGAFNDLLYLGSSISGSRIVNAAIRTNFTGLLAERLIDSQLDCLLRQRVEFEAKTQHV